MGKSLINQINQKMKLPCSIKKGFKMSISHISSNKALDDYEYALWEAGFEYVLRKIQKLNSKKKHSDQ